MEVLGARLSWWTWQFYYNHEKLFESIEEPSKSIWTTLFGENDSGQLEALSGCCHIQFQGEPRKVQYWWTGKYAGEEGVSQPHQLGKCVQGEKIIH